MKIFKNKGRKKCIKNDYFTSIIALEFTMSPLIISADADVPVRTNR